MVSGNNERKKAGGEHIKAVKQLHKRGGTLEDDRALMESRVAEDLS